MSLQETTSLQDGEEVRHMDQIVPKIFEEMGSDSENDSEALVDYCNGATSEQRAAMNDMCIYLCGWTLETIFERCGLTINAKAGSVSV
jgi:hypothetical protein